MEVIRANVLTSVAAATAFWHTLRGRSAAWVPTGAQARRGVAGSMARRVVGVSLVWLVLSNGAAAAGIALAVARNGWEPNWGLLLYLLSSQINVPLMRDLSAELRPGAGGAAIPKPRSAGAGGRTLLAALRSPTGMLPRRWPETLAASAVLLLTGLLASGWVNPMLPWSS
ncbi:Glycosyltransferase OS=Streptomyces microflavus OX=1919 GN=HUT09_11475 PE=4 SV=1 [Streptomyces microflavus]